MYFGCEWSTVVGDFHLALSFLQARAAVCSERARDIKTHHQDKQGNRIDRSLVAKLTLGILHERATYIWRDPRRGNEQGSATSQWIQCS